MTKRPQLDPADPGQAVIILEAMQFGFLEGSPKETLRYLFIKLPWACHCTHANIANVLCMARETVTRNWPQRLGTI